MMSEFVKKLIVIFGTIFLLLGVVGIFLPILPTTPFLLLASYCYFRGSERLHTWLNNHNILGPYIRNYMEHRSVKKNVKIYALLMLWISLIFAIIMLPKIVFKVMLAVIGTVVSIHILKLRTLN